MLLLSIAAVLSGCNGGFDDTKSKGEYKRTDSILKNVRSVDSLRMFVKTYHDSHDTRAEVIAMRELGKRLREESKFSDAIETHRNGLKLAESINRIPDGKIDDFLEATDRLCEVNNARDQSF